jgi:putative transposase
VSNGRRLFAPGVSLHVRQRGNNRCAIFGDDHDYETYLVMLQSAASKFDVDIHGYSLMTTHTHLLLTPTTEHGTAKAMQQLGVRYVMYFNRRYERVGTLWTGRYRAKGIDDSVYWMTCLRYIELNPVRAKLVIEPDQYRWSSYRGHALGEGPEWLASHPVLDALGENDKRRQQAYQAMFATSLTTAELVRQQMKD